MAGFTTASSGINQPNGVAVDAAGNIYIADTGNQAIKEMPAAGGFVTSIASGIYPGPTAVAADPSGNVFFSVQGSNAVEMIPAGGGGPVIIGSGFNLPYGVASRRIGERAGS